MNEIIVQITPEDEVFEEFNFLSENDEYFDDLIYRREEFARVNSQIAKVCGASSIL
jgi:hypothetical protein